PASPAKRPRSRRSAAKAPRSCCFRPTAGSSRWSTTQTTSSSSGGWSPCCAGSEPPARDGTRHPLEAGRLSSAGGARARRLIVSGRSDRGAVLAENLVQGILVVALALMEVLDDEDAGQPVFVVAEPTGSGGGHRDA